MRFPALLLAATLAVPVARERVSPARHLPRAGSGDSVIVSTAWLASHLHDPNVVVLQVDMAMMHDAPYSAGHIPGARELSYDAIAIDKDDLGSQMPSVDSLRAAFEAVGVSDGSRVVVYYSGDAPSAARAFVALDYLGHDRVSFLDGGLPKWRAEGRPLETTTPPVARGTLHPRPHENVIAAAPWIESRIGKPGIALIDTRTDGEYLGTAGRHGMPSEGHLAGARQLQWQQLFTGDSGSAHGEPLKSRAELAKMYADRMRPGDTVVTYCWVGYRASTTYLAARAVGLPVKLYDGSYEEWLRKKLPVNAGSTP
jgi:thiosulfate/3-mercaptopyruvate sulfurtransferase